LYSITPPNPYILGISDWWLKNTGYNNDIRKLGIYTYNSIKSYTLKDVKRQLNNPNVNGYWLELPQKQLSDRYFAELKIINNDYTRNSIWFKFKKYITRKYNYDMV
jgi:hypothetical protein